MASSVKLFLSIFAFLSLSMHLACSPGDSGPGESRKPSNADGMLGRKTYFNTKSASRFSIILSAGPGLMAEHFTVREGAIESSQSLDPSALQFSKNEQTVLLVGQPGIYEFSHAKLEDVISGKTPVPQAMVEALCNKIGPSGYEELLVEYSSGQYGFFAPTPTGKDTIGGNGAISKIEGTRYTTFQKAGFGTLQIDRGDASMEPGFYKALFLNAPAPWSSVPAMECKLNNVPVIQRRYTIFVTSTAFQGDLGGLPGADFLCQGAAQLGTQTKDISQGTWKAFLGHNSLSINSRITLQPNIPLVNTQGDLVLTDSSTLVNLPVLLGGIQYDENGNVSALTHAWSASGQVFHSNCGGWSDGDVSQSGVLGVINSTALYMSNAFPPTDRCDNAHPIFCVNSD